MPAKLAILARTVAPELFARTMTVVNRLMPEVTGSERRSHGGRQDRRNGMGVVEDLAPTIMPPPSENNEL